MHFIKNSFFMCLFYTFFHSSLFAVPLTSITTKGFNRGNQSIQYPSTSFFRRLLHFNFSPYFHITCQENNTDDTAIHSFNYTDTSGNNLAIYRAFIDKKNYFIYESHRPHTLSLISKQEVVDTLDAYFQEKKDPIEFLIYEKYRLEQEYAQESHALSRLKHNINLIENDLEYDEYHRYKRKEQYKKRQKKLLTIKKKMDAHVIRAFDEKLTYADSKKIAPDQWVIVRPTSEEILATFSKHKHALDFTIHISTPFIPDNALLMMAAILHRKHNTFMGQKQDCYWIGAGLLVSFGLAGAINWFTKEKQQVPLGCFRG